MAVEFLNNLGPITRKANSCYNDSRDSIALQRFDKVDHCVLFMKIMERGPIKASLHMVTGCKTLE